jgi:putative colanic acid biosynthesis UDP-glucose lipid carrier transferase
MNPEVFNFVGRGALRLSSPITRYVALSIDALLVACVGVIAYGSYHNQYVWPTELPLNYQFILLGAGVLLAFFSETLYNSWRLKNLGHLLRVLLIVWISVLGIEVVALFLTKLTVEISRAWFVIWAASAYLLLCTERLCVYWLLHALRRRGLNFKTVLVVGRNGIADQAVQAIQTSDFSGMKMIGHINPEELESFMILPQHQQPQEVWICLPLGDEANIKTCLNALNQSVARIRLVPDWFASKLMDHGLSEELGIPMIDLSYSPISGSTWLVKELVDRVLAVIILLLVSPLMVGIAFAIKITMGGPVLFKQVRNGWNGKLIRVYKFRTMKLHEEDPHQITQAQKNDARVTPLGAFLRRTSLDELPQFFNVLQGRMSIVGPRPHAVAHNDYYKQLVPRYMLRHKVKPGITGWAQVNGFRGETDTLEKMEKRVELDLYYIECMSLWLDLKIIVLTLFKGFVHRNAY